jgi:hypothetical protein
MDLHKSLSNFFDLKFQESYKLMDSQEKNPKKKQEEGEESSWLFRLLSQKNSFYQTGQAKLLNWWHQPFSVVFFCSVLVSKKI